MPSSLYFVKSFSFILALMLIVSVLPPAMSHAQTSTAIESDDPQVRQAGTWTTQQAGAASNGSYLYSSGREADVLTLQFSGPSIEVLYVAGPSLGTLAIDVDGTVLRTVITTADQTAYQQSARVDYLTNEAHEVKVYAQEGGVIGVDAFVIPPAPVAEGTLAGNEGDGEAQSSSCTPINTTHRVSLTHLGAQATGNSDDPSVSGDGRYVAFESNAPLVPFDTNSNPDIYVYDRLTCTLELISVNVSRGNSNGSSVNPKISTTGRHVAYMSSASDLVTGDTNNQIDIFVYDRQTFTTTRVSVDSASAQANNSSSNFAISADGRYIAFQSSATNLVSGDTNGQADIFLRDTQTNTTTRVSISDSEAQATGGASSVPAISADGRYIAFESTATNLVTGDTNGLFDIFVRDTQAGTTVRVSVSSTGAQATGGDSFAPTLSANGRYIAFSSNAPNLVTGDTNNFGDIFLRDTQTNTTTRVSVSSAGAQATGGNSFSPAMTSDARYLTFVSGATNLVAADTNATFDVFVRDLQSSQTTRVSLTSSGGQSSGSSAAAPSISPDGSYIAFRSFAADLVVGDTNGSSDIFVTARAQPTTDRLALFNPAFNHVDLINTLADTPPVSAYTAFSAYAPVSGGTWVMGDWNADGQDTPGVYRDGAFYFTNKSGESQSADWRGLWIGVPGPIVAGRFSNTSANDCIGAVDSAPFNSMTVFALYFSCDMSGTTLTPALSFQWLSAPLPNPTFSGTHQFMAGDFNGDGLDSVAVRRNEFIAFGNVNPAAGPAIFDLAQYIGAPGTGDNGSFVVGDWDANGADSFGLFYQNGEFFYRNDLDFNSGVYVNQSVGTPFGNSGVQVATWR